MWRPRHVRRAAGDSGCTIGADSADSGDDSEPDNPDAPDAAYEQLEARILQGAAQNSDAAQEDDVVDPAPPVLPEPAESAPTAPDSVQLPPDPIDLYPAGTTVQVYWEGEKKWYTGNITKTDVWRGPNGLSKQPRRQIHISYDDGVDKVHSLHNTKVRTVVPSEAETGVEEISVAAGTSGSSGGTQLDMPPSWPNSPVNTPRRSQTRRASLRATGRRQQLQRHLLHLSNSICLHRGQIRQSTRQWATLPSELLIFLYYTVFFF